MQRPFLSSSESSYVQAYEGIFFFCGVWTTAVLVQLSKKEVPVAQTSWVQARGESFCAWLPVSEVVHGQEGEVNCAEHQSLLKRSSRDGLENKSEGRTGQYPSVPPSH